MKNLLIIIICLTFLSGCTSTKPYCPTYADNSFVAPIEEQPDSTPRISSFEKVIGIATVYTASNILIYQLQGDVGEEVGKGWTYLAPVVAGAMIYGLYRYIKGNKGMKKEYKQLKDSLYQALPQDTYTRAGREKIQLVLDSLYAPTLKAHGY